MYPRSFTPPKQGSYFLFGPRGTGKSTWLKQHYPDAVYIDLLNSEVYQELLASTSRLQRYISKDKKRVIIDEVQRIPEILNEVHRLIEAEKLEFVLTGSSARSLKRRGTNLLAGRAITKFMYPLSVAEISDDFSLDFALQYGMLPSVWSHPDPKAYLKSYVITYLKEEVQQEGLTRNLGSFTRFLESAALSAGTPLNIASVGRDCGVDRKTAENYFTILEDLLIGFRLPVFRKKAKREMRTQAKFYFFDCGVYYAVRPRGPLDQSEDLSGIALENLFLQEMRAVNEYAGLEYEFYYWNTRSRLEVDFVLYGPRGIHAFEIKRSTRVRESDLKALRAIQSDFPKVKAHLLYGGAERMHLNGVEVYPYKEALVDCEKLIS